MSNFFHLFRYSMGIHALSCDIEKCIPQIPGVQIMTLIKSVNSLETSHQRICVIFIRFLALQHGFSFNFVPSNIKSSRKLHSILSPVNHVWIKLRNRTSWKKA